MSFFALSFSLGPAILFSTIAIAIITNIHIIIAESAVFPPMFSDHTYVCVENG